MEIRCALTLARVALQTLADLNAEAAAAVDNGLSHEIDSAMQAGDADTLAVIAMLTEVRARLSGEDGHDLSDENAWYID